MERVQLEVSQQAIPPTSEHEFLLAPSRPLYELAELAPALPDISSVALDRAPFPTSNDDNAPYYEQTAVRTQSPDYRAATNRTAVIIGEGSLPSALRYMPEDTIVLVDRSPEACALMQIYIDVLRQAETVDEWGDLLARSLLERIGPNGLWQLGENLDYQAKIWQNAGFKHAADDEEAYALAHRLANEKAIIPWCADITNPDDMAELGQAIGSLEGFVTFMNLTNVLQADRSLKSAAEFAERLRLLPVTEYAPILTTSNRAKPAGELYALGATGPFFGLDNLADHGGSTGRANPGSVVRRQYANRRTTREAALDLILHNVVAKTWRPVLANTAVRGVLAAGLTVQYGPSHRREIYSRLFPRQTEEQGVDAEAA